MILVDHVRKEHLCIHEKTNEILFRFTYYVFTSYIERVSLLMQYQLTRLNRELGNADVKMKSAYL